ncbi:MAG: YceI family protein [Phycisphaeraceae bacterium]
MTRSPATLATPATLAAAALTLSLALAGAAHAEAPPVRYHSAETGHKVLVEGTSNIHDWSGTSERILGWVDVPGRWVEREGELRLERALLSAEGSASIHVQIPTGVLEGNRRGLASNMHEALEVEDHPYVTFTLTELREVTRADNTAHWSALGQLAIAGSQQPVELDVAITPLVEDRLRIRVAHDLLMTDFGIDPPRAMMGMARAADEVEVQITWRLERATPQPIFPSGGDSAAHREAMTNVLDAYEAARAALAVDNLAEARAALGDAATAAEVLAGLDAAALDEGAQSTWNAAAQRLNAAASNAAAARTIAAARTAFADLSRAVGDAVQIVGHDHPGAVAYRYVDHRGSAGPTWVQTSGGAGSPYSATVTRSLPQIVAVYAGQRPTMDAE